MHVSKFKSTIWKGHKIAGEFIIDVGGGENKEVINPSTKEPLFSYNISKALVSRAIDCAEIGQKKLLKLGFDQRLELLSKLKQSLLKYESQVIFAMQLEIGKPRWEAVADFKMAIEYLNWVTQNKDLILSNALIAGQHSNQRGKIMLHPVGITCAYLPFSTPITSFASYISSVLISGCSLILFTPVQSSVIANIFTQLDDEVKFPKGSFNLLFADFEFFRYSLSDNRVAAVIYTGSKEHCERLQKNSNKLEDRKLILNSGGKNSTIICDDANIEEAAKGIIYGAFKTSGQLCSSTSRAFVSKPILEKFCYAINNIISKIRIGRTDIEIKNQKGPFMGPLYSEKSVEKFLRFQTMANREAEETLFWGRSLEDNNLKGFFVHPGVHLMKEFNPKSAYQYNILMCPDLAIYSFDDLEEAIEKSNQVDSCLCLSIYTQSQDMIHLRHKIKAPNLFLNLPTVETDAMLPFASRNKNISHTYQGIGMAKDLSYPQILISKENENNNTLDLLEHLN